MKELEKIGTFGLKDCQSSELEEILNDLFFQRTTTTIIDKCPLLTEMIQIVAVGKNTNNNSGKKNTSYKLKCAIQLLFALTDIRSQSNESEFSKIFGLMLMANGAGKALLNMLEPFGLCMSYEW